MKRPLPTRTVLHVSLPNEVVDRITQMARDDHRTKSFVARDLIEKSLAELRDLDESPRRAARR